MVGLFEQWETEQQDKNLDLHFNEWKKYLIPYQSARFLDPDVVYAGKELRLEHSLKGSLSLLPV